MKSKGDAVLIGVSILLVGVAGFFVIKGIMSNKNKGNNQEPPKDKPKKKGSLIIDDSQSANPVFPIKKGSKIDDIKIVQQAIMKYDNRLLPVYKDDGKWGIETQTALQKILKKSTVDSQADLDIIYEMAIAANTKANQSLANVLSGGLLKF